MGPACICFAILCVATRRCRRVAIELYHTRMWSRLSCTHHHFCPWSASRLVWRFLTGAIPSREGAVRLMILRGGTGGCGAAFCHVLDKFRLRGQISCVVCFTVHKRKRSKLLGFSAHGRVWRLVANCILCPWRSTCMWTAYVQTSWSGSGFSEPGNGACNIDAAVAQK